VLSARLQVILEIWVHLSTDGVERAFFGYLRIHWNAVPALPEIQRPLPAVHGQF
jgi:hypothetical protein